jgi:MFS family permease
VEYKEDLPEAIGTWWVASFGFIALALVFSVRALLGLVMPIWDADLGWSRAFVSGTAAVALLVMAGLAPISGRLTDVRGSKVILAWGLGAVAIGCFMIAGTDSQLVFGIAFGAIAAIGFGLVATHVVSTAVETVFTRNRGLAAGIATSGSTAGQFLVVPAIAILVVTLSWRWSFVVLAIACLLLLGCILHLFPKINSAPSASQPVDLDLWADITFILRKPGFHVLFWSYLVCGYTTTGVIETHLLPYAAFCGFGPVPSAAAYGALSAINLAGMLLAGWLCDRMNRPLLLGSIYVVRGLSFILLVNVGADVQSLVVFAALFGLVDYSTVPVTASLIASHIGTRVMGLAFGIVTAAHQIGAAVGAFLGGYLFDLYASYDWVWWSSLWLAAGAGGLVFFLRDRPTMQALNHSNSSCRQEQISG